MACYWPPGITFFFSPKNQVLSLSFLPFQVERGPKRKCTDTERGGYLSADKWREAHRGSAQTQNVMEYLSAESYMDRVSRGSRVWSSHRLTRCAKG